MNVFGMLEEHYKFTTTVVEILLYLAVTSFVPLLSKIRHHIQNKMKHANKLQNRK